MTSEWDVYIYIGSGSPSTHVAVLHRLWHYWRPFVFLNLEGGRRKCTSWKKKKNDWLLFPVKLFILWEVCEGCGRFSNVFRKGRGEQGSVAIRTSPLDAAKYSIYYTLYLPAKVVQYTSSIFLLLNILNLPCSRTVCVIVPYLLCSDAIGNGLLHWLPRNLSHNYIGEAIQQFTEEGHEGDLKFWIWEGYTNTNTNKTVTGSVS